ncbi:transposase [Pectinatus frisingensis]|uniref:transposase n=1 Tax=Pectinatus frisingensis TaxID=865 RepID=UPI0018C451C3
MNFKIDEEGILRCPAGQAFHLQYRQNVKGNRYERQEEVYQCENFTDCQYTSACKKMDKNRTIRLNQELTSMHREAVNNLESIQGALLRMNRSIQSEGTFGIIKNNRWYKRIVRKGMEQVRLEIFLVSIGHNLYKYHNKRLRLKKAA